MPVVRKASFDDAREIAEINAAVWQTAYKNLLPAEVLNTRKADEKRIDDWQQRTDNGKYTILVYDDGEVSGYLWAGPARDDIGIVYEIYALYVKSDRQRQGIGRALLTAYQTQINYAPHYLYMLKGNLPAARFYESMGGKNFPEQNRNKEYADMTFPKSFIFLPGNYKYFFRKSASKCFSYMRCRSA